MGVKGLWTLLGPYCERKPLHEIGGEIVAVDLSGWVCDSQNVADYYTQPKLYLRNLYFRTSYLLLCDITPVFVLEGEAPALKKDTMAARNLIQFRGNLPRAPPKAGAKQDTTRRRFLNVLAQCEKLLISMGVQCVKGIGEAEAMCAHLNSIGAVDGVISQDSDCFVYGAKRIYRNFSVSGAGSGSVDIYDIERVQKSIDIGRNKMVALALLCGSDYNGTGVDGVGTTTAISFLMQHKEADIISRLVSWNTDVEKYEALRRRVEDRTNCGNCGHGGALRTHARQGCPSCVTHKGCNQEFKEWRAHMKTELQIRSKALAGVEVFPNPALLKEFLENKEKIPPHFKPQWARPNLVSFTKLMCKWLCWTESYCVEKFLPLLTRWQLLHYHSMPTHLPLHPLRINKKRNPKGVACYEIVWKDVEGHYTGLVSDDQVQSEADLENLWTTVERQDLVEKAYPQLVEEYIASKQKKKPTKKAKKIGQEGDPIKLTKKKPKEKPDKDVERLETSMNNLSLLDTSNKTKKGKKRKGAADISFKTKSRKTKKKMEDIKQKKINTYLRHEKNNHSLSRDVEQDSNNAKLKQLNSSYRMSPLLSRKKHLFGNVDTTAELLKNLSCDDTGGDDVSEGEISDIVERIISRKNCPNLATIDAVFDCAPTYSTPIKYNAENKSSARKRDKRRVSYFFGPMDNDYDAFEKSIDLKNAQDLIVIDSDSDEIEDCKFVNYSPITKRDGVDKENVHPTFDKDINSKKRTNLFPEDDMTKKVLTLEERLFGIQSNVEITS